MEDAHVCTQLIFSSFFFQLCLSSQVLILVVLTLFHTSYLLQVAYCVSSSVFLPLSFSLSFFLSLCVSLSFSLSHTKTEVIISGRLGLKVCYDKHAAVVINFE